MPFTFCHPAIILPLTKSKKLSSAALIIGSTAPDFEYFLRMDMIRTHSHDFWAIFYFNIPLTILLYYIFQLIVKIPLINNSTSFFYKRFSRLKHQKLSLFSTKNIIIVIISAAIGNFSHLLWDSFTHRTGFFENYFSFLTHKVTYFNTTYFIFELMQFWSSIFGGFYIIYFIYKMPKKLTQLRSNFIQFWVTALLISFTVIYLRDCQNIKQLIATSISSGFIGLIFSSLIFEKMLKKESNC